MIEQWSPEPAKCTDDVFPIQDSQIIEMDMEESEDDPSAQSPYFGYELLSHEPDGNETERIALESDEESGADVVQPPPVNAPQPSCSIDSISQGRQERSDIQFNADEVRQIMTGITLPLTAIPPWAESVPENQWSAFLVSRIRSLQGGGSMSK